MAIPAPRGDGTQPAQCRHNQHGTGTSSLADHPSLEPVAPGSSSPTSDPSNSLHRARLPGKGSALTQHQPHADTTRDTHRDLPDKSLSIRHNNRGRAMRAPLPSNAAGRSGIDPARKHRCGTWRTEPPNNLVQHMKNCATEHPGTAHREPCHRTPQSRILLGHSDDRESLCTPGSTAGDRRAPLRPAAQEPAVAFGEAAQGKEPERAEAVSAGRARGSREPHVALTSPSALLFSLMTLIQASMSSRSSA